MNKPDHKRMAIHDSTSTWHLLAVSIFLICMVFGFAFGIENNQFQEWTILSNLILINFAGFLIVYKLEKTWLFEPIGKPLTRERICSWWKKRLLGYNVFAITIFATSLAGDLFFTVDSSESVRIDFVTFFYVGAILLGFNSFYWICLAIEILCQEISKYTYSQYLLRFYLLLSFCLLTIPLVGRFSSWINQVALLKN